MLQNRVSLQKLAVREKVAGTITRDIKSNILDDEVFWGQTQKLADLLCPIVLQIKKLEGDILTINKVNIVFDEIQSSLEQYLPESPLSKGDENTVLKKVEDRKEFALQPIHLSYMLDPSTQGNKLKPEEKLEAVEYIHKVATDLQDTVECKVLSELAQYQR